MTIFPFSSGDLDLSVDPETFNEYMDAAARYLCLYRGTEKVEHAARGNISNFLHGRYVNCIALAGATAVFAAHAGAEAVIENIGLTLRSLTLIQYGKLLTVMNPRFLNQPLRMKRIYCQRILQDDIYERAGLLSSLFSIHTTTAHLIDTPTIREHSIRAIL